MSLSQTGRDSQATVVKVEFSNNMRYRAVSLPRLSLLLNFYFLSRVRHTQLRPASGKRCDVIGREFEVRGHVDQLSTSTNNKYVEMTGRSSFSDLAVLPNSPGQWARLIAPALSGQRKDLSRDLATMGRHLACMDRLRCPASDRAAVNRR